MSELEKAGVPTTAFVARDFVKVWRTSAPLFGVKELSHAVIPRPLVGMTATDIHPMIDVVFDEVIAMLTRNAAPEADIALGDSAAIIIVEGVDRYAALEEMNRRFLTEGWSDGLPLWAPTRERVDEMLISTRRAPTDLVTVLSPGMGQATVEKIAINAVMAGCEPAHLPVLIAAVEAISDPLYMMRNVSMSTGAHAPLMLVSGPIVEKLGINTGRCALGPGAPSAVNTVLGRAIRLIFMNIGHAYAGTADMDTLGSPTKYSLCLAENLAESPWQPFHTENGFASGDNVVTMFSTYALSEVEDGTGNTPEEILNIVCSTACNQGVKSVGWWLLGKRADPQFSVSAKDKSLLIVCPVHAAVFRKHGWSRQDIRDYLFKHARIPFGRFMANKSAAAFRSSHPELQRLWDTPEELIPVLESPDCFEIIVAGGMGGARSTYSYGAAEPVSRVIEA